MPKTPIALAIGDAHMSHDVPVARGETRTEWYDMMTDVWKQVNDIRCRYHVDLPILAPGDIVHRWNEPHETTNHLIRVMPDVYAVPGNHDLPNHDPNQIRRSAYWTLVEAKKIKTLELGTILRARSYVVGYGFGQSVKPAPPSKYIKIALIHDMIWNNKPYPSVDVNKNISNWLVKVGSYDVAVFGDNHQTVLAQSAISDMKRCPTMVNCGTLMRRRANEREHKPCVAVIYDDASITLEYLNCTKDKWREDIDEVIEVMSECPDHGEEVMETLRALSDTAVDFIDAVRRCAEKTKNKRTRALLIRYAEEVENA